jgi:hypothetical protein
MFLEPTFESDTFRAPRMAGRMNVDEALKASRAAANKAVKQAGLQK